MACDLHERVGPTLRALAGIDPLGGEQEARRRLLAFLDDLARSLPADLRLTLSAGLALDEDVRHRFLDERMRWLAARLQRDVRTARRRVDEAIRFAEASIGTQASGTSDYIPDRWYLARLRTLLRLDGEQPTAIEERTVVGSVEGLTEFVISTSVPRVPAGDPDRSGPDGASRQRLDFNVLYGGSLAGCDQPSASYFRHVIQFPHPLRCGESHEVSVAITIPGDQPFYPRYTFQPLYRCDEFDLRIRFGARSRPAYIWHIRGLPRGMIDDYADPDALVRPDTAGDIHLRYGYLRAGLAYGVRWSG
jgi:hypothetical protein